MPPNKIDIAKWFSPTHLVNFIVGASRSKIVLRTALVSAFSKFISIIGTFVTIPLTINYLGPERFGLWMTIITLFVFLQMADGGVTIGLLTLTSQADGTDNKHRIRELFSSAYAITFFVMLLLFILAALVPLINWGWALKLTDQALQNEATAITIIIICSIAIGYPAGVIVQGRYGLQQGAEVNAWRLVAVILTFIGQITVILFQYGLIALVAVTALTPVAINILLSGAFLLDGANLNLRPSWHLVNMKTSRLLFMTGLVFMALILTQALAVQIDQVLIAKFLGVTSVADYSVTQKLLVQPQFVVTLFLAAQFPAYSEALTRKDFKWVRKHYELTLYAGISFSFFSCLIIGYFTKDILSIWIGNKISPSNILIYSMTIYGIVAVIANIFTYFYFSIGLYHRVLISYAAMIFINIPLTIFLIPHFGSAGAIMATSVGYIVALIVPSFIVLPGILNGLDKLRTKRLTAVGDQP